MKEKEKSNKNKPSIFTSSLIELSNLTRKSKNVSVLGDDDRDVFVDDDDKCPGLDERKLTDAGRLGVPFTFVVVVAAAVAEEVEVDERSVDRDEEEDDEGGADGAAGQ